MKIITTLLFLLFTLVSSYSQTPCPIPNGSFESWIDVTEDFDETGELPAGTIMLPEEYFGLFRFFLSSFTEIFEVLGGEDLIEATSMFFGLYQSTDATDGNFSLQMQSDDQFPFVDAFVGMECPGDELPSSFNFDLKHVGGGADTFSLFGTFNSESSLAIDEYGLQDASAFFVIDSITMEGDSEWTSFNIPVVDNMNGVSPDSVVIFMILTSNEDSLAAGVESYYLVDNLSFQLETVLPLATTSINATFNNTHNEIKWSVANEQNISHYKVERSFDNIDDWHEAAQLDSSTGNANNYNFSDYDISNHGYYYYRVKQVDFNGNEIITPVVQVYVPVQNNFKLVSYPNPARDELNLEIFLKEDAVNLQAQLISADGQSINLENLIPSNLRAGFHNFKIHTSTIPSGIYYLVVKTKFTEVREKIIILNK